MVKDVATQNLNTRVEQLKTRVEHTRGHGDVRGFYTTNKENVTTARPYERDGRAPRLHAILYAAYTIR